jgi:hypothetical protein
MDIGVRATLLMCDDPDAALDFCRGTRSFEARHDAELSGIPWVRPAPPAIPAGRFAGFPFRAESDSPTGST